MKGVPFVSRRYMKEAPCLSKMVYKRVRGWTLVGAFPYKTLVSTPVVTNFSLPHLAVLRPCGSTIIIIIVISFLYRTSVNYLLFTMRKNSPTFHSVKRPSWGPLKSWFKNLLFHLLSTLKSHNLPKVLENFWPSKGPSFLPTYF